MIDRREKNKIRSRTQLAVRNGQIIPPDTCSSCKAKTKLEAHHNNYHDYLDIKWVCRKCHRKEHMKDKKNQPHVEKQNKFTCPVCKKEKLRGVYVTTSEGYEIKICQTADCIQRIRNSAVDISVWS